MQQIRLAIVRNKGLFTTALIPFVFFAIQGCFTGTQKRFLQESDTTLIKPFNGTIAFTYRGREIQVKKKANSQKTYESPVHDELLFAYFDADGWDQYDENRNVDGYIFVQAKQKNRPDYDNFFIAVKKNAGDQKYSLDVGEYDARRFSRFKGR